MKPDNDVYRELQRRIDELPIPFPETSSGVELKLLRALFSPDEAAIALHMSALSETAEVIGRRVPQIDSSELKKTLTRLAKKGAVNSGALRVGNRVERTFGLAPLVVGMFEFQVDKLTGEYLNDFDQYLEEGFRESVFGLKTGQMRTVPVRATVTSERSVAKYRDIRGYIAAHPGPFSVINCVCRQAAEIKGNACTTGSSHETCLMIGHVPQYARKLGQDEVLEILDRAESEGHVLQPQNSRKPAFICCCCRDCCEVLHNARKLPRPADAMPNAYLATVVTADCTACGICVKRCPMDAIQTNEGCAVVAEPRCIGCGLCASTCPHSAITLVRRRGRASTPRNTTMMYLRMEADRRGVSGILKMVSRKIRGRPV